MRRALAARPKRELKLSGILDSSPRRDFPARSGSPCRRRSRLGYRKATRLADRAKRKAESSLINRKARWTLRFVSGHFGVDAWQKAQRGSEIIPFSVSFGLGRPLTFSERGPTLRSYRTPAVRGFPAATVDGSC